MTRGTVDVEDNVLRLVRLAGLEDADGLRDQLEGLLLRRPPAAVQASARLLHDLRSVAGACTAATEARVRKADADAQLLVGAIAARLESGEARTLRQACEALAGQPKRPRLGGQVDRDRWSHDWTVVQRRYGYARKRLAGLVDRSDQDESPRP